MKNTDKSLTEKIVLDVSSIIARKYDLKIRSSDAWAYDTKNHVLFYDWKDLQSKSNDWILGVILHETGHVKYSCLDDYEVPKEHAQAFHSLLNSVEDIRVEKLVQKDFPGAPHLLRILVAPFIKEFTEGISEVDKYAQYCLGPGYCIRDEHFDINILDKEVLGLYDDTKEDLQRCYNAESTTQVYEILRDSIFPKVKHLLPPPKEGQDSENQGEGKEQRGKEKEDSSESGGKDSEDKEQVRIKIDLGMAQEADKRLTEEDRQELEQQSELDKEKHAPKKKEVSAIMKGYEHLFVDEKDYEKVRKFASKKFEYDELYKMISSLLPVFKKKLGDILKDNRWLRYGGRFRTGKLARRGVYKARLGKDTLFQRKVEAKHKDYAIGLVIDESGSMRSGERIVQAVASAILFSETLESLEVLFEVSGFHDDIRIYKPYSHNYSAIKDKLPASIEETSRSGAAYNNDGLAIDRAVKRLLLCPAQHKILFVFSDGLPCTHGEGDRPQYELRRVITKVRESVLLVGIGVGSGTEHVKEYYPEHIVCSNVERLPTITLRELKKFIVRG